MATQTPPLTSRAAGVRALLELGVDQASKIGPPPESADAKKGNAP
jgi:hypothetical protein